jgi:hypothetical protein
LVSIDVSVRRSASKSEAWASVIFSPILEQGGRLRPLLPPEIRCETTVFNCNRYRWKELLFFFLEWFAEKGLAVKSSSGSANPICASGYRDGKKQMMVVRANNVASKSPRRRG